MMSCHLKPWICRWYSKMRQNCRRRHKNSRKMSVDLGDLVVEYLLGVVTIVALGFERAESLFDLKVSVIFSSNFGFPSF